MKSISVAVLTKTNNVLISWESDEDISEDELQALSESIMEEMCEYYDGDVYIGEHDYVFSRVCAIVEQQLPGYDISIDIRETE